MKSPYTALGVLVALISLLGTSAVMAAPGKSHSAMGEVKQVDAAANTVTVVSAAGKKERQMIFHLNPKTTIHRDAQKAAVGDLKEGDHVMVRYADENGRLVAHTIELKNTTAHPAK